MEHLNVEVMCPDGEEGYLRDYFEQKKEMLKNVKQELPNHMVAVVLQPSFQLVHYRIGQLQIKN